MTKQQLMRVLSAINVLEERCLAKDCKLTTAADIRENGAKETKEYYRWLRQQAPMTAMSFPYDFEKLMGPKNKRRY